MKDFNLSAWAINNQALVLYALLALLISGSFAYTQLAQKEDPDFTFKVMTVKLLWPGATAKEMAGQVTDKVERALQETPWLDKLTSYAKPGETVIFVTLKDSMPPAELKPTWQYVRNKLADIKPSLPDNSVAPVINDALGDTFGSMYAFTSDKLSYAELEREAHKTRRELLKIAAVRKVELIGVQEEKVYIEFTNATLSKLGIDPLKIAAIVKAQNAVAPAGEIDAQQALTKVRLNGDFHSLADIEAISIPAQGKTYRLGDISRVYRGYADPAQFKMKVMGKNAIGLAVLAADNADVIELGKNLNDTINRIRARLPEATQIQRIADQPKVVKKSTRELMKSLFEALAIVLLVSFMSLGWRAGLVVALSIPIVMAGTFLLMQAFNIGLHRVSIGALIIAIGLLVDDAMIAVEMMKVKLEQGLSKTNAAIFAYKSTAFPMLTGTLITAAAFLPVGLAKSKAGEYTFSICIVVTVALLVSWLVAVIFTPFIGYKLLPEHPGHIEPLYQNRFYRGFKQLVIACLNYRKTVLVATLAAFLAALAGFSKVEQQFFPPSERPELLVDIWLPQNIAFAATEALADKFTNKLQGDADIVHYTSYVGGPAPRFYLPLDIQVPVINYAQIVVTTRDMNAREVVLKRIRNIINSDFPDFAMRVSRLENGPPVGFPVQFRISGENPETLKSIADAVMQRVKANPNAKNVSQDSNDPVKTVNIDVDHDQARALGLAAPRIAQYLQLFLAQSSVSFYRDADKQVEILLRTSAEDRHNPALLGQLKLYTEEGKSIPLPVIGKIGEAVEEGIIWRENRLPVVTVRADIPDNVQAPDVSAAIEKNLFDIRAKLPPGYQIAVGGAKEESDKSQDSIVAVLPLMGVIILTLLMLQLQRFSLVTLVLLTAPLGVIGVVASLWLWHVPFGFVAMLGMISLAGMIMRNSLILVDQIEQDMALGLSCFDAIVGSTVRRARPILLTASAAILAMIPLTTSVFWGPMAIVIMGGLLVATLLTLLYLPALYATWFAGRHGLNASKASHIEVH